MTNDISEALGRILAKAGARVMPSSVDPPCGALPVMDVARPGVLYCDGLAHYRHNGSEPIRRPPAVGRCPFRVASEVRARIEEERVLLAGALARSGGGRFDGFDGARCKGAVQALEAMLRFSEGRPPSNSVFLAGPPGTGKSRLLLASHMALIIGGIGSRYVTSGDLRELFQRKAGFAEAAKEEAEREIWQLANAPVLHLDDLGDVRGSEAWHANFAAGLKGLLDQRRGVLAVALNGTAEEARNHPDLGDRVLSRLLEGAIVVKLEGRDQRLATARRVP